MKKETEETIAAFNEGYKKAFQDAEEHADRDFIAIKVMQGILANPNSGDPLNIDNLCKSSYRIADAMIKARTATA